MYPKTNFFLYCFLIVGLFASCQLKDTFDWNAGLSAPKYYGATGPFVEFFYQGKSIAGASSGVGIDQGWGITSGGYVGGDKYKPVPDSIAINWICAVDRYYYEGGIKLPREKMLELLKKKSDRFLWRSTRIQSNCSRNGSWRKCHYLDAGRNWQYRNMQI